MNLEQMTTQELLKQTAGEVAEKAIERGEAEIAAMEQELEELPAKVADLESAREAAVDDYAQKLIERIEAGDRSMVPDDIGQSYRIEAANLEQQAKLIPTRIQRHRQEIASLRSHLEKLQEN